MAGVTADDPVAVVPLSCPSSVPARPREVPVQDAYDVVLVSSGCFRYQDGRGDVLVDTTTAVLGAPGQEGETAHPVGGDVATQLLFHPEFWHEVAGRDDAVPLRAHVTPAMQLAHRRRLAAASHDADRLRVQEEAVLLLDSALRQTERGRATGRRPATTTQRRALVEEAKVLLVEDPGQSLTALARALACSPHHLSRVFREATGSTVSDHRQALRFSLVLQDLVERREDSLAEVAVRCGFADHAHLTRTVRRYARTTPVALRAELMRTALRPTA